MELAGPQVDDNPLSFDIRADYFKLADDRVITAFTVQTENRDLVFTDSGGLADCATQYCRENR